MGTMTIGVVVGGADDGRTVKMDGGATVSVAVGVDDPEAFHAIFLSVLSADPK